MGELVIRDGDLARRIKLAEYAGEIEVDISGEEPTVVLPEDVIVRRRERRPDRRSLRW